MNKIEEILSFKSKDVEWKSLEEIAYYPNKRIPISEINLYVGVENLLKDKRGVCKAEITTSSKNAIEFLTGDLLVGNIRPYLKKIWHADCRGGTNGDVVLIRIKESKKNLCSRFLFFFLLSSDKFFDYANQTSKGGKMPRGDKSKILHYIIPIPPLEVQEEIVRLLDEYTKTKDELLDKLKAEIVLRKKQYEYYREKLLSFEGKNVEWKPMGEIADILAGFPFNSSEFTKSGIKLMRGMNIKRGLLDFNADNDRYWKSSEGIEKYLLTANDIVIAMDGSLVGKSYGMVNNKQLPLLLVQRVARIRSTKADIRYIYFFITQSFSQYVDKVKTKGAIPHISMKDISNFKVPVPSLSEQKRIVSILDKYEESLNKLIENLNQEIIKVQQQYEYYREKLLTF